MVGTAHPQRAKWAVVPIVHSGPAGDTLGMAGEPRLPPNPEEPTCVTSLGPSPLQPSAIDTAGGAQQRIQENPAIDPPRSDKPS